MIDWNRTKTDKEYFNKYPKTRKEVLRICDECRNEKWVRFCYYSNLCITCANKKRRGIKFSDETCQKMSNSRKGSNNPFYGKHHSDETKEKNRQSHLGKPSPMKNRHHSNDTKLKISESRKGKYCGKDNHNYKKFGNKNPLYKIPKSNEHKIKISCTKQNIDREDFNGFTSDQKYCSKFNDSCRESNREKYNRKCFICDKDEIENERKLSVHHINMNKNQGCDGNEWELVPLCLQCHHRVHNKLWEYRLKYLINNEG